MSQLSYSGDSLQSAQSGRCADGTPFALAVYLPEPKLVDAVNLALRLNRPLLLMGEPGCGKTRLAEAVAYDLHGKKHCDLFFEWYVKSTTKAQDGIYTFDALRRLRSVQLADRAELEREKAMADAERHAHFLAEKFIQKGPLAEAFEAGKKHGTRAVLLIDEIDKAEIDFPNDLLLELATSRYFVQETNTFIEVEKAHAPLILITSNNEKELPPAFLRRCLFHFITFPKESVLATILAGIFGKARENLQRATIRAFEAIRLRIKKTLSEKQISTSELIDWWRSLEQDLDNGTQTPDELEAKLADISARIEREKIDIPNAQVLIKNFETLRTLLPTATDRG